ncbi:unnamed protein product [Protopolystoma xenopodis]|uniref:Uncharacterized protein n=1 Tax=Protopolystoma xenopodis TaxID=117903 RepID=A0A3S5C703_9PLAT|nr:unnamed protein product [Protopolystoma xenopodis]
MPSSVWVQPYRKSGPMHAQHGQNKRLTGRGKGYRGEKGGHKECTRIQDNNQVASINAIEERCLAKAINQKNGILQDGFSASVPLSCNTHYGLRVHKIGALKARGGGYI